MDLKSGYPFRAIKNGLMHAFPQLQQDIRCDRWHNFCHLDG